MRRRRRVGLLLVAALVLELAIGVVERCSIISRRPVSSELESPLVAVVEGGRIGVVEVEERERWKDEEIGGSPCEWISPAAVTVGTLLLLVVSLPLPLPPPLVLVSLVLVVLAWGARGSIVESEPLVSLSLGFVGWY